MQQPAALKSELDVSEALLQANSNWSNAVSGVMKRAYAGLQTEREALQQARQKLDEDERAFKLEKRAFEVRAPPGSARGRVRHLRAAEQNARFVACPTPCCPLLMLSTHSQDERAKVAQRQSGSQDEVVELSVGGQLHSTTRSTLCRVPGSYLESIFSGRHSLPSDGVGRPFIDRDPALFATFINWLRDPVANAIDIDGQTPEFAKEADFYGLQAAIRSGTYATGDAAGMPVRWALLQNLAPTSSRLQCIHRTRANLVATRSRHPCLVLASSILLPPSH